MPSRSNDHNVGVAYGDRSVQDSPPVPMTTMDPLAFVAAAVGEAPVDTEMREPITRPASTTATAAAASSWRRVTEGTGSLSVPDGAVATRGKDNIARNRHAAPSLRQMVTQRDTWAAFDPAPAHAHTMASPKEAPAPTDNGWWHFTATPCR